MTTPDVMAELVGSMAPSTGATSPVPATPKAFRPRARGAARVVLNRAAIDQLVLAAADGAFELAKTIVGEAEVPDAEPFGEGLVQGGGVVAYVGKKRVGAWNTNGGADVAKPRAAKLGTKDGSITVIGGYGFPGRFQEEGTAEQAAQPFLTPSLLQRLPDAAPFIKEACIKRGIFNKTRSQLGDTFGSKGVTKRTRRAVSKARSAIRKLGTGGGL